ncbi:arylsulfatase B-like isoform X1 [Trichogramma pretiosum]|uniref:arylsulfatase B-like isoform X1 n=1 Tax=Trichogramma pretiosum TaxID=7493 RepID=UPI0006C9B360|nr:arylsulfatase B-like isoform X1 [Trichogramma pretiosum]
MRAIPVTLLLLLLGSVCSQAGPSSSRKKPKSMAREEAGESTRQLPNIVLIVADDMGWNDVSFHGSDQIPTPNIDALAYNGVILNSHYVSAMCTPSRSALLTGKHPIHTGMQHLVILEAEPRGLPLHEKILPQYLKEAGYATHAIGKWHQGFHRREYTPTYRGFDSHFGYWNGLQDYYTHEVASSSAREGYLGFDMRRNMSLAHDTRGKYSTDLFTEEAVRLIERHDAERGPMFMYLAHLAPHSGNDREPLQAPDEHVAKFAYISDPERRIYAAMMSKLDESVGEVVAALRRNSMLHNSIILFMSDNGAATQGIHYNRGSNYPLRGIKASAWEGAVRGAAAIWSPLIERPKRVHDELVYVADWLPTLLSAAGLLDSDAASPLEGIDGFNMWPSISGVTGSEPSPRSEVLVNIDPIFNYSAIRRGDFKYVLGSVGNGDAWYGETGRPEQAEQEGPSPSYDPELVLRSRAGTAISGALTSKQASEARARRHDGYERQLGQQDLLSARELLDIRARAIVRCGEPPKDQKLACDPVKAPCLFNLREDPCEQRNLAETRPMILASLEEALLRHRLTALPPSNVPNDPTANPALWNDTWVNWMDDDPREFLTQSTPNDRVDINPMNAPIDRLPGSVIAVIAVLLALAVLGIFTLIGLSCNKRYNALKKKQQQSAYQSPKNFQQVQQTCETTAVFADNLPESDGKTIDTLTQESTIKKI